MTKAWHERETLWDELGPVLFAARRWEQAPVEVDQLLALLEPPAGATVLDLACGTATMFVV